MKWLLVAVVVVALAYVIVQRARLSSRPVRFTPVEELGPQARAEIDAALADSKEILAVRHYRDATGLSLAAAKTAVDVYRRARGAA